MALNGVNDLYPSESPYSSNVVALQYLDEALLRVDGTTGPNNGTHDQDVRLRRAISDLEPKLIRLTLAYTNFWGEQIAFRIGPIIPRTNDTDLRPFMRTTVPNMMCFDTYPGLRRQYVDTVVHGHAEVPARGAWKGATGPVRRRSPMASTSICSAVRTPLHCPPSPSFVCNGCAWAFGYTFTEDYVYNGALDVPGLSATMFSTYGDDPSTTTPVFG